MGVPSNLNTAQKVGLATGAIGFLFLILALFDLLRPSGSGFMWASILMLGGGVSLYVKGLYQHKTAGIKNDGVWFSSLTNKGVLAWIAGILITAFYVLLYWYPELLGQGEDGAANNGIIAFFDPLAQLMKGQQASEWFVYGVLYTTAILFMGVKFLVKYRHNRYQLIRTASVMFFQLAFAFMLPEILEGLHNGTGYFGKDLKNIWPLNFYFFDSLRLDSMQTGGMLGRSMLFWGIVMIVIGTPVLTYFYGKRWYCSWVCGCGGLAETAGDPFRQLSDKSNEAWQIERIIIYGVLALVTITTSLMIYTYFTEDTLFFKMESTLLNKFTLYLLLILLGGGLYLLQRKIFPSIPPKRIRILIPTIIIAVIAGFEWKFSSGLQLLFRQLQIRGLVRLLYLCLLFRSHWCRFLSNPWQQDLVSFWLSASCHSWTVAALLFKIPHYHQWRAVYLLRKLLYLL